jgi:hypothetical protein
MDGPKVGSAFNESFADCRERRPCARPARRSRPTAVMANLRSLPSNRPGIARHNQGEPFLSMFVQVKGTNVSDQDSRLQGHRVRTSGRPQPSFALGSSEGTPGTGQPWVRADSFGCLVNAGAERSCSNLCGNTADSADVRACSPVSKSLVTLRIRSMANCGEHAAEGWRSRGRRFKSCHPDGK